jgi:hypothetical protein
MVVRGELEQRLTELRSEFEAGRRLESDLQERLRDVSQTLLRVSGAIQVLEELLSADAGHNGAPADAAVEVSAGG